MPQPIVKKYKQGELGMPYPKKKKTQNFNQQIAYLDINEHTGKN